MHGQRSLATEMLEATELDKNEREGKVESKKSSDLFKEVDSLCIGCECFSIIGSISCTTEARLRSGFLHI